MAIHSSILAWRIPGTGEPGGLPSMGSHRVGHDWSDLAAAVWTFFGIALLLIAMQTDLLQCCGHCWVFQICWHIECSTLTASYFRIESDGLCLAAQLCLTLCDPIDCSPPASSVHGDSSGKNTGVGCHVLRQGIFPTQRWNPGLHTAGGFFTVWATRKALNQMHMC